MCKRSEDSPKYIISTSPPLPLHKTPIPLNLNYFPKQSHLLNLSHNTKALSFELTCISHILDPTPLHILHKYTGTFHASPSDPTIPAAYDTLDITLVKGLLILKFPKLALSAAAKSKAQSSAAATKVERVVNPSTLFLSSNSVPPFRISGATPEETELNRDLQALGRLLPSGQMISFVVKGGEIRGINIEVERCERVEVAKK